MRKLGNHSALPGPEGLFIKNLYIITPAAAPPAAIAPIITYIIGKPGSGRFAIFTNVVAVSFNPFLLVTVTLNVRVVFSSTIGAVNSALGVVEFLKSTIGWPPICFH